MKTIPLTQDKVALVDDEDYEYLNQWKWCAYKIGNIYYAIRNICKPKRQQIHMHRIILNAPKEIQVDHKNSNGLDNRRINLRLCNSAENNKHRRLSCRNSTGFKGVSVMKDMIQRSYRVRIQINNRQIYLGCYSTAKEAAQVYDKAALKYYKEFALTNKMLGLLK